MGKKGFHQWRMEWRVAAAVAIVGAAILAYALISPSGRAAVPGWEPVNDKVIAALDAAEHPASRPPADQAAAGRASPARTPTEANQEPASSEAAGGASNRTSAGSVPASDSASASATSTPPSTLPPAASNLLNLNTATAEQLDELKGIGPSKAKAIVDYRAQHGSFRSVDDLLNVKGIGEKLLAGIRADVTV